jgi:CPA2 family monovalent cation:H+ antiporter-2
MDATTSFIADLTASLIAGSVAGAVARALRISPVLGYLLAGVIIGPFTPGYVAQSGNLSGLAQLGLIFLLFSLGLGFSPQELRFVGVVAIGGNLLAMAAIGAAIWFAALKLGMIHPVTLALAFTVSSTAVGAALLDALGLSTTRMAHVALSVLIVQDLVAIMLLVITSTPASALTLVGVGIPLARAVLFVAVALVLGATLLHRLFVAILERGDSDLPVIISTTVALAAAWLGHLAGLTYEFGAFVAGAVISEAAGSRMLQRVVHPFRELFVMLFFVSMGTLMDVGGIRAHWVVLLIVALVAVTARWIAWSGVTRMIPLGSRGMAAFAIVLLPMGEFNIVLGNASFAAGRLNRVEISLLLGASFVTIVVATLAARLEEGRFRQDGGAQKPHT